jgi:hypothetical protein
VTDILIAVPKAQAKHTLEDKLKGDGFAFWTLQYAPKGFRRGDRIWFQIEGQIVAVAMCDSIVVGLTECETTGKVFSGCHLFWECEEVLMLKNPRPKTKLTRGFMYYEGEQHTHELTKEWDWYDGNPDHVFDQMCFYYHNCPACGDEHDSDFSVMSEPSKDGDVIRSSHGGRTPCTGESLVLNVTWTDVPEPEDTPTGDGHHDEFLDECFDEWSEW